ncbi:hypothetical protein HF086_002486 [Spodoptera exigua]|nr:hypothetical protein HF086_002486 [Spodoptera exigua]
MAEPQERFVNVVPTSRVKVKKEIVHDDDDAFHCRLCWKGFASEVALRNHARMEHIDAYASGNPAVWTHVNDKKKQPTEDHIIKLKTEQVLSEMEPTSVMALASNDVSYIIIKAEDGPETKKKRIERVGKKDKEEKQVQRKDKSEPIT